MVMVCIILVAYFLKLQIVVFCIQQPVIKQNYQHSFLLKIIDNNQIVLILDLQLVKLFQNHAEMVEIVD